jgi:hypothetical protein
MTRALLGNVILLLLLSSIVFAGGPPRPAAQVPVIDGEVGPCSVEFKVTDSDGQPVHGAYIRVHVEHGFLGMRKLDLEVGTNADGKARFEGLPEDNLLFFRASKGKLKGVAAFNPEAKCHAQHAIYLIERIGGEQAIEDESEE